MRFKDAVPMSRAFVKEDTPDDPPIIPPRAPLPDGVQNYVTPRGMRLLREEADELERERERLAGDSHPPDSLEEANRQRELAVVTGRIRDLTVRISRAQVVDPTKQDPAVARFGATVEVSADGGEQRTFQLVGVDEADAAEGLVAFTSPVARALTGTRVGDATKIVSPSGEETVRVESIRYGAND